MDELGISADELQILLQITSAPPLVTERLQHLDTVIAAARALLPFERCVVLHERERHTQVVIYRHGPELERQSGSSAGDEHLSIHRYLDSFSRFGTFQNAFFWFARQSRIPADGCIAQVLGAAGLTEGIAGAINLQARRDPGSTTLVQLQYGQERFEAKHLVFANFIANCLHTYFEQSAAAALCAPRSIITVPPPRHPDRWAESCHKTHRPTLASCFPSLIPGSRRPRRTCRHLD